MDSGIYCIENLTTHKKYIGQSIHIKERWKKHKYELNHNSHKNEYLQHAWNKYGEEDFNFTFIEFCDVELLDEKEKYYIGLYNTTDNRYGYNLTFGGQNGAVMTEEANQRRIESLKEYYANSDGKEIQRQNALKQWANPEIKAKISGENSSRLGKHLSEEAKARIGNANRGRISAKRNLIPVYCVELNKRFTNAHIAAKELSIDSGGILKVCRGERYTCGGYHWNFEEKK